MNCLSLEFSLHILWTVVDCGKLNHKTVARNYCEHNRMYKCMHLRTQHITSSSLPSYATKEHTTSYLVRDLRIPPPNRDSHGWSKRKAGMGLHPKDE